ncbi:MAG TPA: MqnA/MqnD/SBP family protein [Nitrososphaeraceae archaeon]|jgi:1,4-dihydroxy-6-naphthoate synthase|nr:MqnA/MqnD/SBP family protein [Nitrososphaeraceae archaeon]
MMEITLGHTPDADDAFMFFGIACGKVYSVDIKIKHVIEDIETLNKHALRHELDVTAISAHAYAYLKDYVILRSGGSFGLNYGPIVISKKKLTLSELRKGVIGIPGKMTSANLLLNLALGKFNGKEMPFQLIPEAVLNDKVDAGLVIHEAQITYDTSSLHTVFDLATWWTANTNGLPMPLGINVASNKSMTLEQIKMFDNLFKESILYGLEHIESAIDYAMKYGRGQPRDVITRFIKMYVNDITIDMGTIGEKSIKKMFAIAEEKGFLSFSKLNFA